VRKIDYIDILSATADLSGLDRDNLSSFDFRKLRTSHNNRLATAYEWYDWPELMRVEKRYLRPDYNASTAYVLGDEVYDSSTDKYYQALSSTTGNGPTNTTYWKEVTRVTDFDPYISLEQTGKTVIGTVYALYNKDPLRYETVTEYDWHLSSNGIQLTDNKNFAYVEYRLRPPALFGDTWSNAKTYSVADQVYFSDSTTKGNFYDCATATNLNESPSSAAAKWTKVDIPYIFGRYLTHAGYVDYLTTDQQGERKAQEELFATELLTNQVTLVSGQQGQYRRVAVSTR
tara:strand:- start:808 stop:1668 length:861 start_codon:yes stop_codon:yes gene_type:complete